LLNVELKLVGRHLNYELQELNFEIAQYYHNVDIWCVNDEYPPVIEIDTRLINFHTPLRFRDLDHFLPEGMWLHRKYDREYNNAIVGMTENYNHILTSHLFPFPNEGEEAQKQGEEGGVNEDEAILQAKEMFEAQNELKKNKTKAKKDIPYILTSSKKLMQLKSAGANAKAVKESLKKGEGKGTDKKKK
jgi:hypothetical protein